jgi:hypothetical protein
MDRTEREGFDRERPAVSRGESDGARVDEAEIHLPAPTVWPFALGLGITLLLFGVVTSPIFTAAGLLLTARAIGGWIGELRHH